MNVIAGLKAAVNSLASGPKAESFRAGVKQVTCPRCENVLFHKQRIILSTTGSAITNTEWLDRSVTVLVCANCSRIEWFYDDLKAEGKP